MREKNYIAKDVISGHRATLAHIWMYDSLTDDYILAKGEAIRHPEDKHDEDLANTLATARALKSLANKLERRANGRIKCNDDNAHKAQEIAEEELIPDGRCHGVTGKGHRCTRKATTWDGYYCRTHN